MFVYIYVYLYPHSCLMNLERASELAAHDNNLVESDFGTIISPLTIYSQTWINQILRDSFQYLFMILV